MVLDSWCGESNYTAALIATGTQFAVDTTNATWSGNRLLIIVCVLLCMATWRSTSVIRFRRQGRDSSVDIDWANPTTRPGFF